MRPRDRETQTTIAGVSIPDCCTYNKALRFDPGLIVPARPHCDLFLSGKDRMQKTIIYNGSEVVVSEEVAQFLEEDRKRQANEGKSDRRHLDFFDPELGLVTDPNIEFSNPPYNALRRKEVITKLHSCLGALDFEELLIIKMYYYEGYTLTRIAEKFGVTKMAISKRHRKLLKELRELMEPWAPVVFLSSVLNYFTVRYII